MFELGTRAIYFSNLFVPFFSDHSSVEMRLLWGAKPVPRGLFQVLLDFEVTREKNGTIDAAMTLLLCAGVLPHRTKLLNIAQAPVKQDSRSH